MTSAASLLDDSVSPRMLTGAALRARAWRALAFALAMSLVLHFAATLWPVDSDPISEPTPLTATLTEMPPPPAPAPIASPKPKPKPKPKRAAPAPPPAPIDVPAEPVAETTAAPEVIGTVPDEPLVGTPVPQAAPVAQAEPEITLGIAPAPNTLPPRIDLAYKMFYGTQGFQVGKAVYRFEHTGNRYRIATVGEATGLAALVYRGKANVESRGLITPAGLQPMEFTFERTIRDRRESAVFDWETGMVTMHENQTASLELPTFDPLSLMWQFYFAPPTQAQHTFAVATTRRLLHYTITREGTETIEWPQGSLDTERWHRKSIDGRTDAYLWLAPSMHYLLVKFRLVHVSRGTVEGSLDSIRVEEARTE
ncbi:MAG: DUF3108 domain-containing protein [Betaproteobacteria bacterium]|nr:DUF3108 domain-containing protein [Betaproteobacteria bacterium]